MEVAFICLLNTYIIVLCTINNKIDCCFVAICKTP